LADAEVGADGLELTVTVTLAQPELPHELSLRT
jgi:hypothetical protein